MRLSIRFFFIIALLLSPTCVYAGVLSRIADQMSTVQGLAQSSHTLQFRVATGVFSGQIRVDLSTVISSGNGVLYADMDFSYGPLGSETAAALSTNPGSNVWGATLDSATRILTLTYPSSNATPLVTGDSVILSIGVRSGTLKPVNASAGNHLQVIITTPSDSGIFAVSLVPSNTVGVAAVRSNSSELFAENLGGAIPAVPVLTGLSGVSTVRVTWEDTSQIETGFIIERKATSPATSFQEIGRVLQNITSFTDSTVAIGATYIYRVRTINGANVSGPSNEGITTISGSNAPSIVNNQSLSEGLPPPPLPPVPAPLPTSSLPIVPEKPSPQEEAAPLPKKISLPPQEKKQPSEKAAKYPTLPQKTSPEEPKQPAAPDSRLNELPTPQKQESSAAPVPLPTLSETLPPPTQGQVSQESLRDQRAAQPLQQQVIELAPVTVTLAAPVRTEINVSQESTVSAVQTNSNGETVGLIAVIPPQTATAPFTMDVAVIPLEQAATIDSDITAAAAQETDERPVDGVMYQVNAFFKDDTPLKKLDACIDLRLKYDSGAVSAFDEATLKIAHWATLRRQWVNEEVNTVDTERKIVSAKVCHLTLFSLRGKSKTKDGISIVSRTVARQTVAVRPITSLLPANNLGLVRAADGTPLATLGRDIYTASFQALKLCVKKDAFGSRKVDTILATLGRTTQELVYDASHACYVADFPARILEGEYPLVVKVIYSDDRTEKLSYRLVVTRATLAQLVPALGAITAGFESSPVKTGVLWFFLLFTAVGFIILVVKEILPRVKRS